MSLKDHASPRILLFFIVILIKIVASVLSGVGFVLSSGVLQITGTVVWLSYFILLFMVAVPATDRLLQPLLRCLRTTAAAITIVILTVGFTFMLITVTADQTSIQADNPEGILSRLVVSLKDILGYNDATALSHQAADNFLDGKNPYAESNIVEAMLEYDCSFNQVTPLRTGRLVNVFPYPSASQLEQLWEDVSTTPEVIPPEIESRFNYPAGCFLMPAAFVWMGIGDFRLIYLILIIPALICTVWLVRSGGVRLLLIGAVLVSVELWYSLAGGETGFLYFPFLLLAWVLYKRNLLLSALCMAAAVSIKQLTWFIFPFYLVLIWRTMGEKKALVALILAFVVFFATNAPFFFRDPELWLTSVMAPISDDMFPLGVGIISLVTGGVLDIQSLLPFVILETIVALVALTWYFFNCRRYPHTGLVLAVLPLFFAWRSLWGYFFYIDIILLAAVMINEYGILSVADNDVPSTRINAVDAV